MKRTKRLMQQLVLVGISILLVGSGLGHPAVAGAVSAEDVPPHTWTVTVAADGEGSGTVSSSVPGLQCGDDCEEEYLDGTALELTATADDGSSFSGWSGACADASEDVCRLDVTEARQVTATFDLATETPESGSPQPAPSGAEVQPPEIEAPGLPSLEPSPAPGPGRRPIRHRLRVTLDHARDVDGVARQSSGTVTSQPAGIRCEEYHFFNLTTQVGCTAGYPVGAQVTLTAEPGAVLDAIGNRTAGTSEFAGWGGACAGEESTTCTVTMDAAKSATARFELPPPPLNLHVTVENQSRTDPTAGYLVKSQGSA